MKKIFLIFVLFFLLVSFFPRVGYTESTEESIEKETVEGIDLSKEQEKTNELGIKSGTEVFGEDISTLTEEELQYIPEGWRDGVLEVEHEHSDNEGSGRIQLRASYPNVNDYIQKNKPSLPKVEYDYKNVFTKFNYRYGFGEVEGIVAHETANEGSTINGEISYMARNHQNAFVHAFVDDNRIIEIHPTGYGAWGAGRFANQRFIHVELVRVNSFEKFARSINNYANYIVSLLYQYNLEVDDAESNGQGTLWSHKAVSKHLGGTTHIDPHGYFQKWGYNWNEFVKLVNSKYEQLPNKKENTSKLGHLRSSNVRIYQDYKNQSLYTAAGTNYTNAVYYIKELAIHNGNLYYLISTQPSKVNGVVGWVRGSDLTSYPHVGVDKNKKVFYITGTGSAYSKAWGGSKELTFKLNKYKNQVFEVNLTEKVGATTWYRGLLDGKQVWVRSDYLTRAKENSTSQLGHIRNTSVNIYKNLDEPTSTFKSGSIYTNQVYYIKKQADVDGTIYYLISQQPSSDKGTIGWVKATDLSLNTHIGVDKQIKTFSIKGSGNAYSKAWGGSKDLVYKLNQFTGQDFTVHLTEKVGNNIWYRGNLNGKTVWMHSSYVTTKEESPTSLLGHIRNSNVSIYKTMGNSLTSFKAGSTNTNQVYYIKKKGKFNGQLYYLISSHPSSERGVLGWVRTSDISTHTHIGVDKEAKTFTIKGTGNAYSTAWGGSKDLVYKLNQFTGQDFAVHLTEKVGNNIWYRGSLNGKTVWMHSSYVTSKEERSTSLLGHIRNSNVSIYKTMGNNLTAFKAGSTNTNRVYYIKKQAKFNGQIYYLISTQPSSERGVLGWVRSSDISTHTHIGVDKETKTFTIKGTGSAYSNAWGGSKDLVYQMSQYKDQVFDIHLTEKVDGNIWYRGVLDNKIVWIHSSYLR